ncbi:unnamed protein product, partial [Phyllotreta striolata]
KNLTLLKFPYLSKSISYILEILFIQISDLHNNYVVIFNEALVKMTENKRVVPPILQNLLKYDAYITNEAVTFAQRFLPFEKYEVYYTALELSCNGLIHLPFWFVFSWLFDYPDFVQMQVNMLFGLCLDVILVAVIKAFVRRRRPHRNVDKYNSQLGPDVYSFPSGHASRAFFVAYFFTVLWPINFIFHLPLIAWALSVGISRLLLNRHYIGDITCGFLLGMFVSNIVGFLWIEESTAKWLFNYVSDDKL